MGGWERQIEGGCEGGGNERENRDGESKIEYSESGEVKVGGREEGGKQHWKANPSIWSTRGQ